MKLYCFTKSMGRAGCANFGWRETDSFESKAELRRYYRRMDTRVLKVFTEEQYNEYKRERGEA